MGRTLKSATQTWIEEEQALRRFSRALRKEDQRLMAELIGLSRLHIAEVSYASNLYPMDAYLISMMLEMYKKMRRMEETLVTLCERNGLPLEPATDIPELPDILQLIQSTAETQK